jgi:hypothetical protein
MALLSGTPHEEHLDANDDGQGKMKTLTMLVGEKRSLQRGQPPQSNLIAVQAARSQTDMAKPKNSSVTEAGTLNAATKEAANATTKTTRERLSQRRVRSERMTLGLSSSES